MSWWIPFAAGLAAFPVAALLLSAGWIEGKRFLTKRRKQPAGPILSLLLNRIENGGQRISARPLIATDTILGRSYALILVKQGPNEPVADRLPNPPFTEPLDDPPADLQGESDGR